MTTDNVQVRLIKHGEHTVSISAAEFRAARDAGELDALLEPHADAVESTTAVVGPDGTLTELYALRGQTRPTLLSAQPTDALAAIIRAIRPRPYCGRCDHPDQTACPEHMAEDLVAAVRLEDLIIMPAADADATLRHFLAERRATDES